MVRELWIRVQGFRWETCVPPGFEVLMGKVLVLET